MSKKMLGVSFLKIMQLFEKNGGYFEVGCDCFDGSVVFKWWPNRPKKERKP